MIEQVQPESPNLPVGKALSTADSNSKNYGDNNKNNNSFLLVGPGMTLHKPLSTPEDTTMQTDAMDDSEMLEREPVGDEQADDGLPPPPPPTRAHKSFTRYALRAAASPVIGAIRKAATGGDGQNNDEVAGGSSPSSLGHGRSSGS